MPGKRKAVVTIPPAKRRKHANIEEIIFDFDAREDYLTGFHKRKLQRIKLAQEEAAKKEREERVEARKILRDGRKADLERHVEAVKVLLEETANLRSGDSENEGGRNAEGDAWDGVENAPEIDHEAEYIDENKYTTVTVEALDVSREGLLKVVGEAEDDPENGPGIGQEGTKVENQTREGTSIAQVGKRKWTRERPPGPKKRKKKFHYESRADRKITRHKERSGNRAKAKGRKE